MQFRTPIYKCQLVRDGSISADKQPKMNASQQAKAVAFELLKNEPQENFVVLCLDTKLKLIGVTTVTIGTLDASLVHPREVFRPAILLNSSAIILAHNHPSGETIPSSEDRMVTARLKTVGQNLGIQVLDHVIVGTEENQTYSFGESGLL